MMKRAALGLVLFVSGCAGMNLTPGARHAVETTKTVVDNVGEVATQTGVPIVGQIAATMSAMLGGIILIDRQLEKRKPKPHVPAS